MFLSVGLHQKKTPRLFLRALRGQVKRLGRQWLFGPGSFCAGKITKKILTTNQEHDVQGIYLKTLYNNLTARIHAIFTLSWRVALFPEPLPCRSTHSHPARGLLSQIKIVTAMALTMDFKIASYFGWRRMCFMADTNVAFLRLWNSGRALEICSQRSWGQTSPAERVNRNEFIIIEYSRDTFAFSPF